MDREDIEKEITERIETHSAVCGAANEKKFIVKSLIVAIALFVATSGGIGTAFTWAWSTEGRLTKAEIKMQTYEDNVDEIKARQIIIIGKIDSLLRR